MFHSNTKPSCIDSLRIRAAKCHVWWIILPVPGFFTCTAGLTVDGVFQCHPRSVVVWYEKRLCEGQAAHLSALTFHAKTFSSTWPLNLTLSSFFAKRTKINAPEGFKSRNQVWKKLIFEIVWQWNGNSPRLFFPKKVRTILIYMVPQYFMTRDFSSLDILFNQLHFVGTKYDHERAI